MSMGKKSSHKNAVRSRKSIKTAFAELLNEKDMSKITVTNIVEKADISRGTFYAHYLDVYDLHHSIEENMTDTINGALDTIGVDDIMKDPSDAIRAGIQFLDENKAYYRLFVTSNEGEAFISEIISILKDRYSVRIGSMTTAANAQAIMSYLVYTLGGIKAFVLDWFDPASTLSANECADMLVRFVNRNRPEELKEVVRKISGQ